MMVWPAKVKPGSVSDYPCVTSDYLPTVLDAIGLKHPKPNHTLDGVSLMPLLEGKKQPSRAPIGFLFSKTTAYNGAQYKIVGRGDTLALYDVLADPYEQKNLAKEKPEELDKLIDGYNAWLESVKGSFHGVEYGTKSLELSKLKWPYKKVKN